jgi:hypothetical protein
MPWTDVVHEEITTALHSPELQDEDATKPFITEDQTRSIWNHLLNGHAHESKENDDPDNVLPPDIAIPQKELLKVVSILVYIHWKHWSDFRSTFFDEAGCPRVDRVDAALPFTLEALRKSDFLGDYANLFHDNQYAFLPIVIKENKDQAFDHNYRLPITSESRDVDTGSYGEVTRIAVARGQFCAKDKIINGTVSLQSKLTRRQMHVS